MVPNVDQPSPDSVATMPILPGEDPWTEEEIATVRAQLEDIIERRRMSLQIAEEDLKDLFSEGAAGAGKDSVDVGSSNFERDQELTLAQSARSQLEQAMLALRRFDSGKYGRCEVCGNPIGKGRLQVFPRATMCVACKKRQEGRR